MRPSAQTFILTLGALIMTTFTTPADAASKEKSIYSVPLTTLQGEKTDLSKFKGQVLLIVNTASECGFTGQYKGLQAIYEKYQKDGFTVLGFPSNDFGAQEPGSAKEIAEFCDRKYRVKFPLFEKNPVGGKDRQPLYSHLIENGPSKEAVAWNFEKFLVSRDGKVIGRFKSKVEPESAELTSKIEEALKTKPGA